VAVVAAEAGVAKAAAATVIAAVTPRNLVRTRTDMVFLPPSTNVFGRGEGPGGSRESCPP